MGKQSGQHSLGQSDGQRKPGRWHFEDCSVVSRGRPGSASTQTAPRRGTRFLPGAWPSAVRLFGSHLQSLERGGSFKASGEVQAAPTAYLSWSPGTDDWGRPHTISLEVLTHLCPLEQADCRRAQVPPQAEVRSLKLKTRWTQSKWGGW